MRQEDHKSKAEDDVADRKVEYKEVSVTIVSPELHIYVHHMDEAKALQELEDKLRQEFTSNSPLTFSKENPPSKGEDSEIFRWKIDNINTMCTFYESI